MRHNFVRCENMQGSVSKCSECGEIISRGVLEDGPILDDCPGKFSLNDSLDYNNDTASETKKSTMHTDSAYLFKTFYIVYKEGFQTKFEDCKVEITPEFIIVVTDAQTVFIPIAKIDSMRAAH